MGDCKDDQCANCSAKKNLIEIKCGSCKSERLLVVYDKDSKQLGMLCPACELVVLVLYNVNFAHPDQDANSYVGGIC